ncbi:MAG TPA: AmmeMemoRadiSam system radical SAM enzyme [bacterium]|nr:MAG: Pyruvate formate-lyase 1-activating enzyme [bacterium ADurb.Bin270]HPW45147.1 AmmeMemoRadiSam system radical SAM enzyme [bacterium]
MKEAMLYTKEENGAARCGMCRHTCLIRDGEKGICDVRINREGRLYSIFYGKPIAVAVDPVEKKPLFHFMPGTKTLSIATRGCNFHCDFCQNSDISQFKGGSNDELSGSEFTPTKIVAAANSGRAKSISYTYTEPTVFFEYAYDTARLAKESGLGNIFVTNGYMTRDAIDAISPFLDAANIDLKSFRNDTYRSVIGARLDGVLDSIKYMKSKGIWIEITTLVIPGMNDSEAELSDVANFIVETGRDIPWHISRFTPRYKMSDRQPTPIKTLQRAHEIGKKAGLKYIYIGNLPGDSSETTFCAACGFQLIERCRYEITLNNVPHDGNCPKCGAKVDGIMLKTKS